MKNLFISSIILILFKSSIYSQACCSAGTPLLGSLEASSSVAKTLQVGLTFDYNSLQTVLEGTNKLNDNTRERLTKSALLEISYGIDKRWAITGLFSFTNQKRLIRGNNSQLNEVSTNGLGDVILLFKYNILLLDIVNQTELSIGLGTKFPTGKADLFNNGILLPADLQSGSGSYDFLLWGYYSRGSIFDLPMNLISNISYKINTSYNRFNNLNSGYKFGNELIFSTGLGYRTDSILDFSLFIRFRNTARDIFSREAVPNTGGSWLYLIPGVNLKLTDYFTTRISSQLPIFRNLQGTQLTTTYTASLSLFYVFSFQNNFLGG